MIGAHEMNDRELLAAIKATGDKMLLQSLWDRYANLVHKNWAILRRQMDGSGLIMNMHDDFYSESYIAFRKAVDAIDLSKVRDDKWKFIGYFRFYLKNVRADMISLLLKRYQHEKSFYLETADGDEVARIDTMPEVIDTEGMKFDPVEITERRAAEERCELVVRECKQGWDDRRKQIFSLREAGIAKHVIAETLKVHPATITYYLQSMKKDIETKLAAL